MTPAMKVVFGLLAFVAVGMIIGAFLQLAIIRRLEDSHDFPTFKGDLNGQKDGDLLLRRGLSFWENDKDAEILRIGYIPMQGINSGWELGTPLSLTQPETRANFHLARIVKERNKQSDKVKPDIISWSPRIIILHNFLSMQECDQLRAIAHPRLQVSTVVDVKTGKGFRSEVRTSSGMFLNAKERQSTMVQAIEKRISVYSQVPVENGELIQVLRYEKDQYYKPHHDYFSDTFNLQRGGQRIATMLMYLSDNVEGGETYFPQAGSGDCSCGGKTMKGLSVKPIKGDAVLFWSMGLDGESDPKSIHGGCEVLSGEKWSATKWMRQKATS